MSYCPSTVRAVWQIIFDGADMHALRLVRLPTVVFELEKSARAHQTRVSGTAETLGVHVKSVGVSHREFMVVSRSDISALVSRLLDELMRQYYTSSCTGLSGCFQVIIPHSQQNQREHNKRRQNP